MMYDWVLKQTNKDEYNKLLVKNKRILLKEEEGNKKVAHFDHISPQQSDYETD
jgi:hypothetical protein